jgi:tRNA modification GTPase
MNGSDDTIAAVATAPGRGGIGVVRISGDNAEAICKAVCHRLPPPRTASLCRFHAADGEVIDSGITLRFCSPRSYTGEDVVELHGHGGPVVQQLLLARVLECGARHAGPGEFTQRAFLNGKLDLSQAEAVADLIDAGSRQAALAAQRSLSGAFSERVAQLSRGLTALRVQVEARLDFPDEELDGEADPALLARADAVLTDFDDCLQVTHAGRRLSDATVVVIAGEPNAGKSSLMNALVGGRRAIVTATPGTTRDVIMEQVLIQGLQVQLCDTAGLRASDDEIEQAGIALTLERLAGADIVVAVVDASLSRESQEDSVSALVERIPSTARVLWVLNKIDLDGPRVGENDGRVHISAKTGAGLDLLRDTLARMVGASLPEGEFTARQRHVDGLSRAQVFARQACTLIRQGQGEELAAEELRLAQQCLDALTGRITSDDVLGEIFASFCIGK